MTKTITWLSVIAIAGVIGFGAFAFQPKALAGAPEPIEIEDASVKIKKKFLTATIETEDNIPQDGSAGLYGIGILASGTNNVLAITSHLCASDSPLQSNAPDSICPDASAFGLLEALTGGLLLNKDFDGADLHPHILDLKPADGYCATLPGAALEVDFTSTLGSGNNVSPTDYFLKVKKDTIRINAPLGGGDVTPDGSGIGIVSFQIGAEVTGSVITDLCVTNVTPFTGDD